MSFPQEKKGNPWGRSYKKPPVFACWREGTTFVCVLRTEQGQATVEMTLRCAARMLFSGGVAKGIVRQNELGPNAPGDHVHLLLNNTMRKGHPAKEMSVFDGKSNRLLAEVIIKEADLLEALTGGAAEADYRKSGGDKKPADINLTQGETHDQG